jgi:hypothetical protein
MNNLSMVDFQIFPSRYEQNSSGEKMCWVGGQNSSDESKISLQPFQTAAIDGHSNPEWGFHLNSTGKPDEYILKYVKMSDPLGYWYGVSVNKEKLILKKWEIGVNFIVKKIGAYYTLEYQGKHVECENGNLGHTTSIQLNDITPPTYTQVSKYEKIPSESFRILWKFIKMDHIRGNDWMTILNTDQSKSNLKINKLFIPGTHDSGTENNTQFNQTQYHSIAAQARMGVRYFDLRVSTEWQIYHGSNSGIDLKYVVNSVVDHLKNYPHEFFILQITPEEKTGFSSLLFDYLKLNCSSVFQHSYMSNTIPTLDEAKGKIIFFARFYTPVNHTEANFPFCEHRLDWKDKLGGGFAAHSPFKSLNVYVQDNYDIYDQNKFDNYIKPTLLKKMFTGTSPDWIINFTSVANKYPIHSAEYINPLVANLLMWTHTTPSPTGILMIDDARVGNVANIIALNFV